VFTNGAWTFSDSGSYIFTDPIGSVSANAGFSFTNGPCDKKAATYDTYKKGNNKSTIAPTFQSGFNLNQNPVPLPQNSFSQERAVQHARGHAHSRQRPGPGAPHLHRVRRYSTEERTIGWEPGD